MWYHCSSCSCIWLGYIHQRFGILFGKITDEGWLNPAILCLGLLLKFKLIVSILIVIARLNCSFISAQIFCRELYFMGIVFVANMVT